MHINVKHMPTLRYRGANNSAMMMVDVTETPNCANNAHRRIKRPKGHPESHPVLKPMAETSLARVEPTTPDISRGRRPTVSTSIAGRMLMRHKLAHKITA